MIEIAELKQYFPKIGNWISAKPFSFIILLEQDSNQEIFIINLKIKQEDTKDGHLIKFKLGLGKDKASKSQTHVGNKPHFEIDIYKRENQSFSANLYFTFEDKSDDTILSYAKGTIVLITKILQKFISDNELSPAIVDELLYSDEILDELGTFENILMEALLECYKTSNLVLRQDGEKIVIKTLHNFKKYMNQTDLEPLYLPLLKKIEE